MIFTSVFKKQNRYSPEQVSTLDKLHFGAEKNKSTEITIADLMPAEQSY
jgi:hypothetical protein